MRFLAPTAAALTALTLLAGCSSAGSSDEPLESSTQAHASTSASKSGSASAKPSPKPTGAQVVQIGGPDSKDTKETARKEAFEAVKQYARIQSAWGTHNGDIKDFSAEDLKKFLEGDALKQMQDLYTGLMEDAAKGSSQAGKGQIEVGLLDMDNAGLVDFGNGKTWEHGSVQLRICENWSRVKDANGNPVMQPDKAKRVIRASVVRGEDGYYYLRSYWVDHYGCD